MLTELQQIAFRFHSRAFFMLYSIPVFWDENFSQLKFSHSTVSWIPWITTLLSVSAFGMASLITPIFYAFFRPNYHMDKTQATILILTGIILLLSTVIATTTFKNLQDIISTMNEVMKICEKLTREYPFKRPSSGIWHEQLRDRLTDRYGLALFLAVTFGGAAPFLVTFGALYTGYDLTYVIIDEVSDPIYREFNAIIFSLAIRTFIVFFFTLEGARTITFFACCALCGVDHGAKIIAVLMQRVSHFQQFLRTYTHLRLLHSKIQSWVDVIMYFCVGGLFWATVGCCWCCVKCHGKIPWPVYYASVLSASFLIVGHLVVLPPAVKAAEMCNKVVEVHYKRARMNFALWKTRKTRISLKQGAACAPIKLKYGMFWVIRKQFVVDYFGLLMLRTFDAILIIDVQ